jgi:hypothetical protein
MAQVWWVLLGEEGGSFSVASTWWKGVSFLGVDVVASSDWLSDDVDVYVGYVSLKERFSGLFPKIQVPCNLERMVGGFRI